MEPSVWCALCHRMVLVTQDGRTDDPVSLAKRKLRRICEANGCESDPTYRAGILI